MPAARLGGSRPLLPGYTPPDNWADVQYGGPAPLRYVGEISPRPLHPHEPQGRDRIIDKHAAHERQLSKLAANYRNVPAQRCWSR